MAQKMWFIMVFLIRKKIFLKIVDPDCPKTGGYIVTIVENIVAVCNGMSKGVMECLKHAKSFYGRY